VNWWLELERTKGKDEDRGPKKRVEYIPLLIKLKLSDLPRIRNMFIQRTIGSLPSFFKFSFGNVVLYLKVRRATK
jgi:hypothetical protein